MRINALAIAAVVALTTGCINPAEDSLPDRYAVHFTAVHVQYGEPNSTVHLSLAGLREGIHIKEIQAVFPAAGAPTAASPTRLIPAPQEMLMNSATEYEVPNVPVYSPGNASLLVLVEYSIWSAQVLRVLYFTSCLDQSNLAENFTAPGCEVVDSEENLSHAKRFIGFSDNPGKAAHRLPSFQSKTYWEPVCNFCYS